MSNRCECWNCPIPATRALAGATRTYRACEEHAPYMKWWKRDEEFESYASSEEARIVEEAMYGDD